MAKHALQILLGALLILLWQRCAQVGELTGGKRDTAPPKLLDAIPQNKSTGFNGDLIVMKFDEFVQVKDLSSQLIVSPKLKTAPEISADGRSIKVLLKKEELAPNTTYRIYFGNAIADMNESNSIQKFEYVFSTGSFIDTLRMKGTVNDAFNNKPAGNIIVGLYTNETFNDSSAYKTTPDYFTRSNENGEFELGNLPYRSFNIVAFSDKNRNGLYDGETEKVGFLGEKMALASDTSIRLKLFQEEASKGFIKKTSAPFYGLSQLILNKKARVQVRTLKSGLANNISETLPGKEKDTVAVFYKDIKDTLELLVNNITYKKQDTVKLVLPRDNSAKKRLKSFTLNLRSGSLPLNSSLKLSFLTWMDTGKTDLTKIRLSSKEDSLIATVPVKGRWTSITDFELAAPFKQGINYSIKVDSMAFFDVKGYTNDTLASNFKAQSRLEFGKATVKLLLNKKQHYIIQLINSNEQTVKELPLSLSLSSSNAASLDFTDVVPGTYGVRIVFDDNENNKWDTGNLLLKQQPERVIVPSKQMKVLSDWETEEEFVIKE